jgi:hypothetical protein
MRVLNSESAKSAHYESLKTNETDKEWFIALILMGYKIPDFLKKSGI